MDVRLPFSLASVVVMSVASSVVTAGGVVDTGPGENCAVQHIDLAVGLLAGVTIIEI
jgi:hypothetical protein